MTQSTINRLKKIYNIETNDGKIRQIVFNNCDNLSDYIDLMVKISN